MEQLQPTPVRRGFYRTALGLAIPIAFQNLLTSSASLIDTAMITSLGNATVSAMGAATRFTFLLNTICFGFASGCATLLSQFWGARDERGIRHAFGFATAVSLIFSLLYAVALALFPTALVHIFTSEAEVIPLAADYLRTFSLGVPFLVFSQVASTSLRAVERVKAPLFSALLAVGVNVLFNYALIHGNLGCPALGLRGAAIGSVASCITQAIFLLAVILFCRTPLRGRLREYFSFSREFCLTYLRTAAPVLLNETLWAVGANVFSMVYGRQGVENYSGYTLYETVQQIFFVFFVGICGACSVMVGMRVGEGEHEEAYQTAKRFAIMTPLCGVVLGALLILLRMPLLSLFPIETEGARQAAADCMLFYGTWISFRMIPYTMICGIYRAGGDTRTGCLLDLICLYALSIPAVLLTALLIRPSRIVVLVAVMFIAEDLPKAILCIRHFRSRKWIRQITAPTPAEAADEQP